MHTPDFKPACWTDTEPTEIRVPWAIDGGRACMQAATPEQWDEALKHTPGCEGCARAERGMRVWWGARMSIEAIPCRAEWPLGAFPVSDTATKPSGDF